MTNLSIGNKAAKITSSLGHPIVLGVISVAYVNYNFFTRNEALKLGAQLLFGLVVPLIIYIWVQIKRGIFKDFDVSNQESRKKLYWVILILILFQICLLFVFENSILVRLGAIIVFAQIALSFIINNWIKISLHSSFAFLVSTMAYTVSFPFAFLLFMFAIAVGFSRVYLGRHTSIEVFLGTVLGVFCGFIFNLVYIL